MFLVCNSEIRATFLANVRDVFLFKMCFKREKTESKYGIFCNGYVLIHKK